jgi:hypothetical protein
VPGTNGAGDQPIAFVDDAAPHLTVIQSGRRPDASPGAAATPDANGAGSPGTTAPEPDTGDASSGGGLPPIVVVGAVVVLALAALLFFSPYLRRGGRGGGP